MHPNIAVFRHPDHLPDRQELAASIHTSLQTMSLDAGNLAKMSEDAIKGLYGMREDVILYWAHHEKLCLIDGRIAFMGGLDLCFGRWDTNQHELADVHGQDLNEIVFPGQDYNNARVSDFHDVAHWEQNQLDRKKTSRMGWSDISVSLHGPVVEDLRKHFVQRWNFIYDLKYQSRNNSRYSRLALYGRPTSSAQQQGQPQAGQAQKPPASSQSGAGAAPAAPSWQQQPASPQPGANPGPPTPSWQHQATTSQPSGYPSNTQPSNPTTPAAPTWQQHAASPQQQQGGYPTSPAPNPGSQEKPSWQQQAAPSQPSSYNNPQTPNTAAPSWQHAASPQQQQGGYSASSAANTGSQEKPNWQQAASPQQGGYSATPPPNPASQEKPSWQQQSPEPPAYSAQGATQHYTYTGDSFPPPPSGPPPAQGSAQAQYQPQQQAQTPSQSQAPYYPPPPNQQLQHSQTRGVHDAPHGGYADSERGFGRLRENIMGYSNTLRGELAGQIHQYQDRFSGHARQTSQPRGGMTCQIVRSCSKWSNGTPTEHSIQDAYAAIIRNSQHFIYIENQFFITATGDAQKPVQNKIGAAIVERILRAARAGEKYKIVVVIPSVPCFAGDLSDESTLGTRAIMEFQYNCINRGGSSIMELIAKEGFNPMDYIRFYNLRNYDRINVSGPLMEAEQRSGVNYEDARKQQDVVTGGPGGYGPGAPRAAFDTTAPYQQYQQAAQQVASGKSAPGKWDSVSSCYMLNGEDIRNVPWEGPAEAEIDAFVTEELYVHSKVC